MMNNYNPYNGFNAMNPQQIQQQFNEQMKQYSNLYNQNRNNGKTDFIGVYVNDYSEVENAQVNMNGTPTMFCAKDIFWIKKMVNGQTYINAYQFSPLNNIGEPQASQPQANVQQAQGQPSEPQTPPFDLNEFAKAIENNFNELNKNLNKLNGRISKLEGKGDK